MRPFSILPIALLAVLLTSLPSRPYAQENTPGLIRAIGTDSSSIENAFYLWTTFDNDFSPYHWVYLYGEGLFALDKELGLEVDFPDLLTYTPLGKYPLALGPTGLYLRYEPFHSGSWDSETAGSLAFQAGGAYARPLGPYRYLGSSFTLKLLGGYRWGKFFVQGNYAYQGGIDPQSLSVWQADNACGLSLGGPFTIQMEADLYAVTAPFQDSSWTFTPQVAFQEGEWLVEFGESFNDHPAGETQVLVARAF
ncbi:MAG TPA: hypothetical protein VHE12_09585 [bacterium]|nr:hypothetical protein [bacterium]